VLLAVNETVVVLLEVVPVTEELKLSVVSVVELAVPDVRVLEVEVAEVSVGVMDVLVDELVRVFVEIAFRMDSDTNVQEPEPGLSEIISRIPLVA